MAYDNTRRSVTEYFTNSTLTGLNPNTIASSATTRSPFAWLENPWVFASAGQFLTIVFVIVMLVLCRKRLCKCRAKKKVDEPKSDHYTLPSTYKTDEDEDDDHDKMSPKRGKTVQDIDMYGYSIVDHYDEPRQTHSGYVEVVEGLEEDSKTLSHKGYAGGPIYLEPKGKSIKTAQKGYETSTLPTLPEVYSESRQVSCRDVCDEYNLNDIPGELVDEDLEGSFSKFHTYFTSMKSKGGGRGRGHTGAGMFNRSETLPIPTKSRSPKQDRKAQSDNYGSEIVVKTVYKTKVGNYDIPPPKLDKTVKISSIFKRPSLKRNHGGEVGIKNKNSIQVDDDDDEFESLR